jgi:hypothetical protein
MNIAVTRAAVKTGCLVARTCFISGLDHAGKTMLSLVNRL